jgi:hypothetical protein
MTRLYDNGPIKAGYGVIVFRFELRQLLALFGAPCAAI